MTFRVTKTYGHDLGLSCAFRQWRAKSHCHLLHGYPLAITLVFEASVLDENNWVIDFGALRDLKAKLADTFDHKTIVAADDPELTWFAQAAERGICQIKVLPSTGCEAFARYVYDMTTSWLASAGHAPRVRLVSVDVSEHEANSASYRP